MSWTKVASNRYERPADVFEAVTKDLCQSVATFDREHWIISAVAHFEVDDMAHDEIFRLVQRAWVQLRFNHPAVAVIAEDSTLSYKIPDNDFEVQQWLASTAIFEDGRSIKDFFRVTKPTKYNTIHYFPNTSQVLIRMHHWLLDGTGAVALLDRLFELLVQDAPTPQFGDEWRRLPPSFLQIASLPSEPAPAAKEIGEAMFAKYVGNLPSIGLPYNLPLQGLGGTRLERISKDGQFGNRLATGSRAKGVSVASAVHAAMAVATGEMVAPALAKRNYISMALFNYRSYLEAPYDTIKSWPAGCYLVVVPFTLTPTDFATQAKAFYEIYRQPLRRGESPTMDGWITFIKQLGALAAQGFPPDVPLPSQPQLSSLGVLDRYIKSSYSGVKRLTVRDVEVVSDQMTPTIVVTQWSFDGTWHLSAYYNENFYNESYVNQFLEKVLEVLTKGLEIEA